ncbi:MAG: hypothetical protein JWN86_922 [Planctomycetota bacterium]|nr:hypothetical protein [Planctomycetota bacterium]
MSLSSTPPNTTAGEPAWDVARLFPAQGHWSEQDYLHLGGNRLVEFADGHIEVLPMPTMLHQLMVAFLHEALMAFASPRHLGTTLFAPFAVRIRAGKYREPDVLFMLARHADRMGEQFWDGADLVMEVESEDRHHDLETKRLEYARAGIPECWIVDPLMKTITVLVLDADADSYAVHGTFTPGQAATSRLLPGFSVAADEAFEAFVPPQ